MNVLCINKFFFLKGGAEHVFFDSAHLLEKYGHNVVFFSMQHPYNFSSPYVKYFVSEVNYELANLSEAIRSSSKLLYSFDSKKKLAELLGEEKSLDIAHLHNIYHQISPSIIHTLSKFGIPIVMTLHDYKMVCASYSMLNNGSVCDVCKAGKYYNCFFRGCVKDSRAKSLLNTIEMYLHHKILHIYDLVDFFISPSRFLKSKLEEMGFKKNIVYLPNFVRLEEFKPQFEWQENSIVYFGRLSKEKGLFTLIEAVKGLDMKLKIIGEGPIRESLELGVRSNGVNNVEFLGYKIGEELKNEISKSMFVVLPSEWYENNPMSVLEAFALGKPIIGSRIGGIPELVKDNETGLTFEPWNSDDLREKILQLLKSPNEIEQMGRNARKMVEEEFNSEKHYEKLIKIYKQVQIK